MMAGRLGCVPRSSGRPPNGDASMKRQLLTLVLSGFLGSLCLVGNAEACHKRRCHCAPEPTCAVVEPTPCPPPAPVCEPSWRRSRSAACSPASRGSGSASTTRSHALRNRLPAPPSRAVRLWPTTRLRSATRPPPSTPPPKCRLSTESALLPDLPLIACSCHA